MKKFIFLLLYFLISFCSFAQQSKIDSLENVLKTAKEDITKINTLNTLAWTFKSKEPEKAMDYARQALRLGEDMLNAINKGTLEEMKFKQTIAASYNIIGIIHDIQGNYIAALKHHSQALAINKEIGNRQGIAGSYNNIGKIYEQEGSYPEALKNQYAALKIAEEIKDKILIAHSYDNIGVIYMKQGNFPEALKNQFEALKINEDIGDKYGIASSYNDIGNIYELQGNFHEALKNYFASLKIKKDVGDKYGIAGCYGNIGNIYDDQGKYSEALENDFQALKIFEELGGKYGIAGSYSNIGQIFTKQKNYIQAILYLNKSSLLMKELGDKDGAQEIYIHLSEVYQKTGDYKKAFEYYKLYSNIKDTLLNSENSKHIAQMSAEYESDKKDNEIKLLNKDKEVQDAELKKQRLVSYSVIGGLFLVLMLAFFIYRGYRQKQKANLTLESAYHVIEEKNKDITDSINYAKRIQQAILPSTELIYKTLEQSFVLYKPKDVVSGDFYAFAQRNDKILMAAVDCTGHGVPGAFMSMIGNDLLNQIIVEKNIAQPAEILNHLHIGVQRALKQDQQGAETRDGMDIALVALSLNSSPSERGEVVRAEYSGANRPLYLIRYNTTIVEEVKPNKFPIAGIQTEEERKFTNHDIQLNKGDTIYIFTDGFVDQFGGERKKKFMSKRFQELLLSIQSQTMKEQNKILDKAIEDWKGSLEQVDDILVIGIRI